MLTLYDFLESGNGYKVRLLLTQLGRPFQLVKLDIYAGATRTPQFLKKNPNGRIPTLELEDGTFLFESGAIAWYLAEGTPFAPADRLARAQTLQWMFFEQYSHEPYIAVARSILRYLPPDSPRRAELPGLQERGNQALAVMEQHLQREPFFAAGRCTIADIALYAYTHCAADGGFDMARYGAVRAWLERVEAEPRFVPLQA